MWGKVDDKLWGSPKWLATPKGARALWVTALSWCMDHLTDGRVPKYALPVLGATTKDGNDLVRSGLWERDGDNYVFHDWSDYQPDAASITARRSAESEAGRRGNHLRWHTKRGVTVDGCEFCASGTPSGTRSTTRSGKGESGPESSRTRTPTNSSREKKAEYVTREDEGTHPPLETSIPRHKLPAGWGPSAEHHARCLEAGLNLSREVDKFRAHARGQGRVSLDWDAEFTRWLIGSAERHEERTANQVPAGTDRQALILRSEMQRAQAADAAENIVRFPEIGAS